MKFFLKHPKYAVFFLALTGLLFLVSSRAYSLAAPCSDSLDEPTCGGTCPEGQVCGYVGVGMCECGTIDYNIEAIIDEPTIEIPPIDIPPIDIPFPEIPPYEPPIPTDIDLSAEIWCDTCSDGVTTTPAYCTPYIEGTNTPLSVSDPDDWSKPSEICGTCRCGEEYRNATCQPVQQSKLIRKNIRINGIGRWVSCTVYYDECKCVDNTADQTFPID